MTVNSGDKSSTDRKSIRLKGYDYSQPGAYFVTVCTFGMRNLFGRIIQGEIILNQPGSLVETELMNLPDSFPNIMIFKDEYVIMPNHLHVIIWITDVGATEPVARTPSHTLQPQSLGAIIGQFKSRVSKKIKKLENSPSDPIWQRNYYDRIIRNNRELLFIKRYIQFNPCYWEERFSTE